MDPMPLKVVHGIARPSAPHPKTNHILGAHGRAAPGQRISACVRSARCLLTSWSVRAASSACTLCHSVPDASRNGRGTRPSQRCVTRALAHPRSRLEIADEESWQRSHDHNPLYEYRRSLSSKVSARHGRHAAGRVTSLAKAPMLQGGWPRSQRPGGVPRDRGL